MKKSMKKLFSLVLTVTMIMRLSEYENVKVDNKFTDVKNTNWFAEPAKWAVKNKITMDKKFEDLNKLSTSGKETMEWRVNQKLIYGVSDTLLSPKTGANRAQMATIFMRFLEKYVEK